MASSPTSSMRKRMIVAACLLLVGGFSVVIVRLFYLQVIDYQKYQADAMQQQLRITPVGASRGEIQDRNGITLAKSATVWTVYISPADIPDEDVEDIANGLAEILGTDPQKAIDACENKSNYYYEIKKKVERPEAEKVLEFANENDYDGIHLGEDTKRYYPYGNFLAQVLGFTGTDNTGLSGIEAYYDSYLQGTPGKTVSIKNAWGTDMPYKYQQIYPAQDGYNVVLTIDQTVQHYVEKHLETAVKEHNVQNRACCIVMDVTTGEILAMATKPDFDPNEPFEIYDESAKARLAELTGEAYQEQLQIEQNAQWRNKAISDPYEPGSVFKVITASAALEEQTSTLGSTFVCSGQLTVAGTVIHCWKDGGHGAEDFTHAVMNSCNPAFVAIGTNLGAEKFMEYFKNFGLTTKTGIDLPGEAGSIYNSLENIGPVELASHSFGQTFKITPIQLITAVSAAINGGYLYEPHIVKQITDSEGNVIENYEPVLVRQVISEETSAIMAEICELVVSEGGGSNGYVAGYRIGGKTGTAQKIDRVTEEGEEEKDYYVASFWGFAPADDPKYAVLLLLDEADSYSIYGSVIAAPAVANIMADILPYLGVEAKYTEEEMQNMDVNVPAVTDMLTSLAQSKLQQQGLNARIIGDGDTVLRQVPSAGNPIPSGGTVLLYTDDTEVEQVEVPNVIGDTAAIANQKISGAGLNVKLVGTRLDDATTVAITQDPPADTLVDPMTVITVEFHSTEEIT